MKTNVKTLGIVTVGMVLLAAGLSHRLRHHDTSGGMSVGAPSLLPANRPATSIALPVRRNGGPPLLRLAVRHDGHPVGDATLTVETGLRPFSAVSSKRGTAEIQFPAPGHVTVRAEATGFAPWSREMDAEPGAQSLNIDLIPAATITGSVTGYHGTPAGLRVTAIGDEDGHLRAAPIALDGSFTIGDLVAGTYTIGFERNDSAQRTSTCIWSPAIARTWYWRCRRRARSRCKPSFPALLQGAGARFCG